MLPYVPVRFRNVLILFFGIATASVAFYVFPRTREEQTLPPPLPEPTLKAPSILSSALRELAERAAVSPAEARAFAQTHGIRIAPDDTVTVEVRFSAAASPDALRAVGAVIVNHVAPIALIRVPMARLEALAALPGIVGVHLPAEPNQAP